MRRKKDHTLRRFYSRIMGLMNRGVVVAMDNNTQNPKLTVKDKTSPERDVELFLPYGFTYSLHPDDIVDVLTMSPSGSGDYLIALGFTGGANRPTDGKPGEPIIWSRLDKENPHRIHLKDDGSILASTGTGTLELKEESLTGTIGGSTMELKDDQFQVKIGSSTLTLKDGEFEISVGGNTFKIDGSGTTTPKEIKSDDDVKAGSISLKTHKHLGVTPGSGTTGLPQ